MSHAHNETPSDGRSAALAPALCSALRRPSKRDRFTRGFVCAVAQLVEMHGYSTESKDLLKVAGNLNYILKHADEEDIEALRSAGLIPQNNQDDQRPKR